MIAFGVAWILVQPILQFFFGDSLSFITEMQTPEVFVLTSAIAVFIVYQLNHILESNLNQARATSAQVARRQEILLGLAKRRSQNLQAGLGEIITAAAKELNIERVGVWLYNEDRSAIETRAAYVNGDLSTESQQISAQDYPAYFAALDQTGMIVAPRARTHPATIELKASYLEPLDVHSLLDVPIWVDGEIFGIICNEKVGTELEWTPEDQEFGHSLADLCALLIVADRRLKIQQELQETQHYLEEAQDAGQFGSFRWVPELNEITCSGKIMETLGFKTGPQRDDTTETLSRLTRQHATHLVRVLTRAYRSHEPFRTRVQTNPDYGSRHFEVRARYRFVTELDRGHFEGTVHDITEQLEIERDNKRLEGQLIQSQKMESIGTLAGGIAHDFNNILTPILGYTDVALSDLEKDDPLRVPLTEILNGSLRAKDLVEQILLFSRRFDETREAVDIEQIINSSLRLLRATLPASIEIDVKIDPNHKRVIADSTQMIQVVVNLCTNAWHAMRQDGGTLTLTLGSAEKNGELMTVLKVSDTGIGISNNAQTRIFEPFYTTKDVGEGTGLGLSTVHGIVTKLGGYIELDSQPGLGSTFAVFLPTTDQQENVTKQEDQPVSTGSGSILVVDDDQAVARILESMLVDLGYKADVEINSEIALQKFRQHPELYDMVVTDLTMPNLSGAELCEKVRDIEPNIPLLVLSGYPRDMVSDKLPDLDHCQIIAKPLVRADLAAAMAKELP